MLAHKEILYKRSKFFRKSIPGVRGKVCRVSFVTLTNYAIKAQWKPSSIELLMAELKAEHLQRAFSYVNKHYIKRICKYSAIKKLSTLDRHAFTILIENELS